MVSGHWNKFGRNRSRPDRRSRIIQYGNIIAKLTGHCFFASVQAFMTNFILLSI